MIALALVLIASLNAYQCVLSADSANRNTSLKIKTWLIARVLFSGCLLFIASAV